MSHKMRKQLELQIRQIEFNPIDEGGPLNGVDKDERVPSTGFRLRLPHSNGKERRLLIRRNENEVPNHGRLPGQRGQRVLRRGQPSSPRRKEIGDLHNLVPIDGTQPMPGRRGSGTPRGAIRGGQ
ncbi:hypothetical protein IQ63_12855 [Streptomyces acidiscabies]|uniref:Uncharacterized protein n=1 Tax=Streptomyces acidiscabies TaxID=42234 RepID=A0A0L0KEY0_9ACTN|nr:hypothetical protein IQ63_12855 [Streptomyces acidiscabies]